MPRSHLQRERTGWLLLPVNTPSAPSRYFAPVFLLAQPPLQNEGTNTCWLVNASRHQVPFKSVGDWVPFFSTKVTAIFRVPAFTGTRICNRASMIFKALSGPISDVA